jgi:transcriptional regulator with XRE-family HTH domain
LNEIERIQLLTVNSKHIYTLRKIMRNAEIRQEIGARLLEERARLNLTQLAMAGAIGSARLSVIHYESGRSSPAAETLAAMESIGVDVRYVLTGMRQAPSGIDRERFKTAYEEVQRQAKTRREKLSTDTCLDLAWRFYDALSALQPDRRRHSPTQKSAAL